MSNFQNRKVNIKKPVLNRRLFFIFLFISFGFVDNVQAQQRIEQRVQALEDYVETVGPSMQKISNSMQGTLQIYGQQLEIDLQNFSKDLQISVDSQISKIDYKRVQLDPSSKAFQRIDTNVGIFLIAVSKLVSIENGVRVHLNIGNMHNADFSNFSLSVFWGTSYSDGDSAHSWDAWRKSLTGAEYTFKGKLKKGRWSPVSIDLVPGDTRSMGFIECQMSVAAVELESW